MPRSRLRTSTALAIVCVIASVSAQATAVEVVGEMVHVRAPAFRFIKDEVLRRLKDGRSVRIELQLDALARPGASSAAQSRETFVLSYDLWEERFAVTQLSPSSSSTANPSRSVSHLSAAGAEAWCLGRLGIPIASLGRLGRDEGMWVRLGYQTSDGDEGSSQADDGFSIRGLIDRLSRRGRSGELKESIEAGPFRINRN
jgi:hypothetical protein